MPMSMAVACPHLGIGCILDWACAASLRFNTAAKLSSWVGSWLLGAVEIVRTLNPSPAEGLPGAPQLVLHAHWHLVSHSAPESVS